MIRPDPARPGTVVRSQPPPAPIPASTSAPAPAPAPAGGAIVRRIGPRGPILQYRLPTRFEHTRAELPIPRLPAALHQTRILHLSDLHFRRHWCRGHERIGRLTQIDPPDLILITGDFVDDRRDPSRALPLLRRFLAGLRSRLGIFGILGNHDAALPRSFFDDSPVRLIDGERLLIWRGDSAIELIGLPGPLRKSLHDDFLTAPPPAPPPPAPARPDAAPPPPRIVLSHYPDHLMRVAPAIQPDLFLAGHTHGGQVCLPGRIPIFRHDRLPRRLCTGIHRHLGAWLIVNRGLGMTQIPLRLFCPPQILELVLIDPSHGLAGPTDRR